MPTLASLLERGAWARRRTPPACSSAPCGRRSTRGCRPATHGRYCFRQLVPGTYLVHNTRRRHDRPRPAVLGPAQRRRARVAVLDVPHSFVVEGLDGIQLVDWGAHDANPGFQTWPPSLAEEVDGFGDAPGRHRLQRRSPHAPRSSTCSARTCCRASTLRLRDGRALPRPGAVGPVRVRLLGGALRRPPVLAPARPGPPAPRPGARPDRNGDPLPQVYRALDDRARPAARPRGSGDHDDRAAQPRHGPHYGGNFLLDEILRRLDGATRAGRTASPGREPERSSAACCRRRPRRWLHGYRIRQAEQGSRQLDVESAYVRRLPIDPRPVDASPYRTTTSIGAIRLNIRAASRRASSIPPPSTPCADDQRRAARARQRRAAATEPCAGSCAPREPYDGPHVGDLPDLLVEWDWRSPIRSVSSPTIGTVAADDPENRTGDHRPEGFVVAVGPNVVPGRIDGKLPVGRHRADARRPLRRRARRRRRPRRRGDRRHGRRDGLIGSRSEEQRPAAGRCHGPGRRGRRRGGPSGRAGQGIGPGRAWLINHHHAARTLRTRRTAQPVAAESAVELHVGHAVAEELARQRAQPAAVAVVDDGVRHEAELERGELGPPEELHVGAATDVGLVEAADGVEDVAAVRRSWRRPRTAGSRAPTGSSSSGTRDREAATSGLFSDRRSHAAADEVGAVEPTPSRATHPVVDHVVGVAEQDEVAGGRPSADVAGVVDAVALHRAHDAETGQPVGPRAVRPRRCRRTTGCRRRRPRTEGRPAAPPAPPAGLEGWRRRCARARRRSPSDRSGVAPLRMDVSSLVRSSTPPKQRVTPLALGT